ncbi:DUF1772 domain-containing protein [Nocardia sp. NPDC051990]|uniref:DUF1772 domain-containing protein n=1 Tax=Nocardia sp. NPDC051990 TaxID=3155285 RepID=UPI003441746D
MPLDVRFTFHTALMRVNGPVMQALMGLAVLSTLILATRSKCWPRWIAASASALTFLSFLVTRFGNVPINQQIKRWAVSTPPSDYAEILRRWELFHFTRTGCALLAFILMIAVVIGSTRPHDDARAARPATHNPSAEIPATGQVKVVPLGIALLGSRPAASSFGTGFDEFAYLLPLFRNRRDLTPEKRR